jgi:hypothetical protein
MQYTGAIVMDVLKKTCVQHQKREELFTVTIIKNGLTTIGNELKVNHLKY